jgi:hypothetical protein
MARSLRDPSLECAVTRFRWKPTLISKLSQNLKCSPLNKGLPPKPVLRHVESPERRGIYGRSTAFSSPQRDFVCINQFTDPYDARSERVTYAPLQPIVADSASPSSIGSDEDGFEVSPSLRSYPYNSPDIAVGATINARKVSATAIAVQSKKSGLLRDGQLASLLNTKPDQVSRSGFTQRRLPTTKQVAALRNGSSPVSRHAPKSRFNPSKGFDTSPYGSQKRAHRSEIEVKRKMEIMDNVSDTGSSSGFSSPHHQLDDLTRRSVRYDLGGPTIRASNDAYEIIMGNRAA